MSLTGMLDRITAFSDKLHGCGASDEDIRTAEESLQVVLPESYKIFLRRLGWAEFSHAQLYGLGEDVPVYLDLVRNTEIERNEAHPHMPRHLVPVMNDGAGNHYCLDTSIQSGTESAVVLWNHELGVHQTPENVSEAFHIWLIELLDRLQSGHS